ncbi:AraC family transcriptional regulator [Streptomyces sp. TRM S81-3]|uniref:AraC family transcriptional regulator n=1 Tax=Streptomyces griseicoloratus TaxID=2752516 RepID=A0A926QP67_9ACTN|nr:AraC family transcriptional regulator [Streptomyces griseicoloratus]MBD0418210.1 AraC family transcriptional regulator [Streptomyces griseicoloratus]
MTTLSGRIHTVSPLPTLRDEEFFSLALAAADSVLITRDGDEVPLRAGDLVFCDPGQQRSPRFSEDCQVTFFRLPRRYLALSEADWDRVTGMTVRGSEGLGALVSDFLVALAAGVEGHGPKVIHQLTRTAVDLLVVLVMEILHAEPQGGTLRVTQARGEMLARVRNYIEKHLADPDLSPQSIARANHISVRYLHKLFQYGGTTVSQWVLQRRLDSCRHELSRTPNRRITVAAVAHRWGFVSPAHFSRTFRAAYGLTPSQWQALSSP